MSDEERYLVRHPNGTLTQNKPEIADNHARKEGYAIYLIERPSDLPEQEVTDKSGSKEGTHNAD